MYAMYVMYHVCYSSYVCYVEYVRFVCYVLGGAPLPVSVANEGLLKSPTKYGYC